MSREERMDMVTALVAEAKVLVSRSILTASAAREAKSASVCHRTGEEVVKRADDMVKCSNNMLAFLLEHRSNLVDGSGEIAA